MKFEMRILLLPILLALASGPSSLAQAGPAAPQLPLGEATVITGVQTGPAASQLSVGDVLLTAGTAGVTRGCAGDPGFYRLLNLIIETGEVVCIVAGSLFLLVALTRTLDPARQRWRHALTGVLIMTIGISIPGAVSWCFSTARDLNWL